MITMIRPSENARVTNLDDITSIRYSYGNQDGYVINKGQELSHTVNGQNFIINSGRIVLQGVESDIDDNGVSIFVDALSEKRYHLVYYNVNMATDSVSVELLSSVSNYPNVDYGDDFNQVSSGISRLPLYKFTSQNGVISAVEKVVKPIEYSGKALVGYDSSKGTIEERLTRLGFKQGTMSLNSATISQNPTISVNSLKRQGNYVIFEFKSSGTFKYSGETYKETIDGYEYTFTMISIGTLPADFVPLNDLNPTVLAKYSVYVSNKYETRYSIGLQITKDGRVWIQNGIAGFTDSEKNIMDLEFCLGYEAKPLE